MLLPGEIDRQAKILGDRPVKNELGPSLASPLGAGNPRDSSAFLKPQGTENLVPKTVPSSTFPVGAGPSGPSLASQLKLGAAQYPNDNTISNLGDRSGAQALAHRTQGALLANQGYQPISDAGSGGTMVRSQGGMTEYKTPQGSMHLPDNAFNSLLWEGGGRNTAGRQGGGTLSVVSGRTPAEQGDIDARVANINQQTEALRQHNIDTGRSYAPAGTSLMPAESAAVDPFARAGDRFGDSQMRAAQYDSLIRQGGEGRGLTKNQRAALNSSAAALLAPGMGAAQLAGEMQASRNSLAGQWAHAGATQAAAQSAAQQKAQEANQRLGLDQQLLGQEAQFKAAELGMNGQRLGLDAQVKGSELGLKQVQAQHDQFKADVFKAYADAQSRDDQASIDKLTPLMGYLYPQKPPDSLAELLRPEQK